MWNLCGFCLVFSAFLIALIKFIDQGEVSKCEMTYMYNEPQYIRIQMDRSLRSKYPAYNLYLYGEGPYAEWLREHNYHGIPVLFLPGNSGSHKQVRSLASIALTKASKSGSSLHFNYFSIDFNEEFSAFYGKVLFRQTDYAAICVKHILSLYEGRSSHPKSVLIIGHSMILGGVVARALLTLPHFDSSLVNVIITLAAPNLQPVAQPDPDVTDFYGRTSALWLEKSRAGRLKHINLVSVGGGNRDLMVRSDLVRIPPWMASPSDIVTLTTAIPGVWTSTDHLCIVWCNQLMLSIIRATFKLVDRSTGQISSDVNKRSVVLREFLVSGTGRAHKLALPDDGATFVADLSWQKAGSDKQRYVANAEAAPSSALLLPLKKAKDFVMVATGFDMEPWIFGCNDPQPFSGSNDTDEMALCKVKEAFPHKSLYVPIGKTFWKVFVCDKECRRKASNLVVKLPSEQQNVGIFTEIFRISDRSLNATLWDLLLKDVSFVVPDKSIFFQVLLPDLTETWQAYSLIVHTSGSNCPAQAGAFHFHVPWSTEDTFDTIYSKGTETHLVHLFLSRNLVSADEKRFPEIRFYLHPDCKVRIDVRFSVLDSLEQVIRFHLYWLPALLAAALLQMLSKQFANLSETGECSATWRKVSFYNDFGFLLKVYILSAAFGMLSKASSLPLLSPSFSISTVSTFIIINFLYVASGAFLAILCALGSLSAMLSGKVLAILLKCFRLTDNPKRSSRSLISVLGPLSLCALLFFISVKTCGSVGLLALQVISAIKLLHSHVKFWRSGPAREHESKVAQCRLSVSFYLFWGMLFQLNCPAFIFWIKNIKYEQHLDPDPSFLPALFMILAFFCQGEATLTRRCLRTRYFHILSVTQQLFAAAVLLFGLDHIYLTSWILAFDAVAMTAWYWAVRFSAGEDDQRETSRRKVDRQREGIQNKGKEAR